VACYVGHFDKRLDGELMIGVTERLPGWTFVLAGRVSHRLGPRLVRLPNVVSLGTLPLADVPAVIAGANACLMPYRADGWADTLFPLKLIEYLAAGKPVVSTPIRAAREFADVVTLASDQAEFAEALEAAVATDSPDARRRRIERVDGFSWERRIDQMQNAIEAAAGRAHAG
jgi:glycosyltransferase involved in cell wall biosynthesis